MGCSLASIVWAVFFSAALLLLFLKRFQNVPKKSRPPGPPALPLIGNMLDLVGTMPHQALYKLRPKYGPVIWLQLGTVGTIVVQSAKAAAELFKNHDLPFADRKCPGALTAHGYNQGSLAVGNYGAYWRVLRRLCSAELFISKRINDTASVRRKCIDDMIRCIEGESEGSKARGGQGEVNVPHLLFLMAFNLVGNLIFSKDLLNSKSEKGLDFFDAMNKIMEWAGKPNVADFLPFLKWVDPQGIQKGMMHDMGRAIKIAAGFVQERTQEEKSEKEKAKDFLDALLEFEGDAKEAVDKMSDKNIKIIILIRDSSCQCSWTSHSGGLVAKATADLSRTIDPGFSDYRVPDVHQQTMATTRPWLDMVHIGVLRRLFSAELDCALDKNTILA
ncbi:Cytochrome P450 [Dillenia turbinata]|uniref:Cytochrome P450 n=1 Tax=Dillenia turbinata TaxID=194707 RepID=A0AAN8VYE7_9MAGN